MNSKERKNFLRIGAIEGEMMDAIFEDFFW